MIQPKEFGGVGGAEFNGSIETDSAFVGFGKNVWVHVFNAGTAVGDGGEIAFLSILGFNAPVLF